MSIFLENFYIIGFVFLGALILFSNRKKTVPLNSDLSVYDEKIKHLEVEIRTSVTDASKFKALAEERKAEADKLNQDLSKLRNKLDFENEEKTNLSNKVSELIAQSHAERKSSEEKIQILTQFRKDMETKFKELASEALQIQGENFSKSNIEKLEATLLPLKEHVGHFEKELRQVHEETVKDRERLKAEINQLSKKSDQISQNALELSKALKGDSQMQGAWGEMILESILEKSGLRHIVSIRSHINGLSAKGYQFAENSSVDYVILFIPIEGALSEALRMDGRITEYAMEKNITIATPTTLMMALKTISNVWDVERRNKNAELIADRAGKLYDKVSGFILNMEKVGERLTQARDSYEVAFNQFSKGRGNVLAQVESLKTLGAKTTKSINTEFDKSEEIEKPEEL